MQTDVTETQADPVIAQTIEPDAPQPEVNLPPAPVKPRRGGMGGAVFGGVIAALAGFAVAQMVPEGWPLAATTDLSLEIVAQTSRIDALQDQLAALPAQPIPDPAVVSRLSALETQPAFDPAPFENRILALESRLSSIEKLPADGTGASAAAVAALQADVQALRQAADAQASISAANQIEAQQTAAQSTAASNELLVAARRLTAMAALQTAFDTGAAYAPELAELQSGTDPISAILTQFADQGLPTLVDLRTAFPPAARLALDAALRADMGDSWTERATSFFRSQTGARSLTPRDGTDPDAVLSRAEAALAIDDLATVLAELQALPPEAQPALAEWRALAETRVAAGLAIAALAATLGK